MLCAGPVAGNKVGYLRRSVLARRAQDGEYTSLGGGQNKADQFVEKKSLFL